MLSLGMNGHFNESSENYIPCFDPQDHSAFQQTVGITTIVFPRSALVVCQDLCELHSVVRITTSRRNGLMNFPSSDEPAGCNIRSHL